MPTNPQIAKFAKEKGIDEEVANDAIASFFIYFKNTLKDKSFPEIRLKNLGTFKVAISRVKSDLAFLDSNYAKGLVGEEFYNYKRQQYITFLNNNALKEKYGK